jgi:hypothetical protein
LTRLVFLFLFPIVLAALVTSGCEDQQADRDERLHSANQAALESQRQQNQLVAAQSQALADNSRQITAAAQAVLSHEKEVRSQLNQQQQQLDAGRSDLEKQRQVSAQQRGREPLIAAAVQSVGLWLACTTPLVLALYVLRLMFAQSPEHAAVAELLVSELTTEQPKLLPAPVFSPARLVHQPSPEQPGSGDPSPHD